MNQDKSYVRVDEGGVYRVGSSRVMLDSVVVAFHQGHSPETIKQQYPTLTLEEVYGSLAYYLAHGAEIEAYLQRQDAVWEQWQTRSEQQPSPVVERLRAAESQCPGVAMSRSRFLADHDLNEHIIDGVLRREPTLVFVRARDVGLQDLPDPEVLAYAAENTFLLVSHDVNTMAGHAYARIAVGEPMRGLLMVSSNPTDWTGDR